MKYSLMCKSIKKINFIEFHQFIDELKGLTGYIDDEQLRVHSSSDANAARGAHKGSPTLGSGGNI